jgi:cysteine desulfurase / selenocysteine lyase
MTATFDAKAVRRDFPVLGNSFRDKPLVYLDNASTSQKPEVVIEALANFYRESNSNVHRGVYALAEEAEAAYHQARKKIADHLHADHEEIVFVRGTTEAINLVAQSYGRPHLASGDNIIVTEMEHHANIVPWQMVAEQTGAVVKAAPIDEQGDIDREALRELFAQGAKVLAITHISNALGTINPVTEIIAEAKERGIVTVIDGAQSVPHGPVDVKALDCDFFAFSGHKVFGPMGIGVLYGRKDKLAQMSPYQGGGDMIDEVTIEKTTFAAPPQRFEAGTPNVAGAIGLGVALEYFDALDHEAIAAHEQALLERATTGLSALPGLTIHGQATNKAAVISFSVDGIHPHDIATFLDADGIAIRAGHHCCQPLMTRLGETATARASFAFYNLPEEIDRLVATVSRTIDCFR